MIKKEGKCDKCFIGCDKIYHVTIQDVCLKTESANNNYVIRDGIYPGYCLTSFHVCEKCKLKIEDF